MIDLCVLHRGRGLAQPWRLLSLRCLGGLIEPWRGMPRQSPLAPQFAICRGSPTNALTLEAGEALRSQ